MNKQSDSHLTSTLLEHWNPTDLAYVERLDFTTQDAGTASVVIVALFQARRAASHWPNVDRPLRRLTIQFSGVNGLCLNNFGGGCVQIMGFDIQQVSNRGFEGTQFEINDYEDGRIKFTCASIHVLNKENEDIFL